MICMNPLASVRNKNLFKFINMFSFFLKIASNSRIILNKAEVRIMKLQKSAYTDTIKKQQTIIEYIIYK